MKFGKYLALSALYAGAVFADASSMISHMRNIQERSDSFSSAVSNYDGSYRTMVPVAVEAIRSHSTSQKARKAFEESEPIPEEDAPGVTEEAIKTNDAVKRVLDAAATKDKTAEDSGFKSFGAMLISHFSGEQKKVSDAYMRKMEETNTHGPLQQPVNDLSDHFANTLKRFS
ncbi:hypothetical protein BDV25DRAFT_135953 [Aspergillus avenaceus]|uniref:DUF4142 domain-containing protein n=1 Tax=Aspergillus avenaceus TaxID=36643 RepID=A0A5N6U6I3_ASPAV|nr:hypothetical protein BDV25DRAFT_135953 [Aspergillus avenaceus]